MNFQNYHKYQTIILNVELKFQNVQFRLEEDVLKKEIIVMIMMIKQTASIIKKIIKFVFGQMENAQIKQLHRIQKLIKNAKISFHLVQQNMRMDALIDYYLEKIKQRMLVKKILLAMIVFAQENNAFDKICENALNTYTTNKKSQEYLGYVLNKKCGAAIIQEACNKNIYGTLSHWNRYDSVPKTCKNAGSSNIGRDQCTQYMDTRTKSPDETTGCKHRTCDNASLSFNTYTQCLNQLQNGNCVPKFEGGCRIETKCEDNMLKESYLRDINDQVIFGGMANYN
ncbi:unnamed protein product [Paramecium pentaurelia]|uniref:Uncharacterized protein n=1 Tax=Paramecium pentaurelia TaxID=43138 RepID=A0A8S1W3L9_9CILI|nr:unnamed protein product [Paramecium pentaurelia]